MPAPTHDLALVDGHQPVTRRAETSNPYSPVMIVLTLVAMLGILAYASFLLRPSTRGDFLPWIFVIAAEAILIGHALLSMWTILSGNQDPRGYAFHDARSSLFDRSAIARDRLERRPRKWPVRLDGERVTVDVFITVYGEPLDVIRRTAAAAKQIRGRHRTWILDDGRSDEVAALAAELGVRYVRRLSSGGAKAGNVNHALTIAKGDFFAIFDADFVPEPDFLEETLPFFVDRNVAFVQTPQTYGNLTNLVSRGAGYMQAVFYRFIQPGRNRFNAAFCVGTNVIFRRKAIDDIGGMYTDSKSEDVWTSLTLHERGWRSVYIPKTLAVGDAPDTIEAYTKQQMRWATGGFEIMLTHNPFGRKRHLTLDQRIMYFVTATFYLTGIAPLFLLLVPPMEVFFDLHPVNITVGTGTWALFYFGFYGMQVLLAFYTLGSFRWECLMLAAASFPIYLQALVNAVSGKEQKWHVTGTTTKAASPFNFVIPQILTFTFLAITSAVAVWRDHHNGHVSLAAVWCITNTLILGVFLLAAWRERLGQLREAKGRSRHGRDVRTEEAAAAAVDGPVAEPSLVIARPDILTDHPVLIDTTDTPVKEEVLS